MKEHVQKANAMYQDFIDNRTVIAELYKCAIKANPTRPPADYISMIMMHEHYSGSHDGLNSSAHIRRILREENIYTGRGCIETELKIKEPTLVKRKYYVGDELVLNNKWLLRSLRSS